MKVREVMTKGVVSIHPDETAEVAARQLAHYNIGILPVCGSDGKMQGLVTDRDLVVRCMAANRMPAQTKVRQIMTSQVTAADPEMDVAVASHLMGRKQVRRLPVVENGRLCGMIGLGDIAGTEDEIINAADALADITSNVSAR